MFDKDSPHHAHVIIRSGLLKIKVSLKTFFLFSRWRLNGFQKIYSGGRDWNVKQNRRRDFRRQ